MSRFLGSKNFRISTNCCPAKMAAMSISAPTYFFTDKPKSINQGENHYNSKHVELFEYSKWEFKMPLWQRQQQQERQKC